MEDLDWELNTSELCKKANSRISLLVQIKICWYMSTEYLLKTCISFIRCLRVCLCGIALATLTVNQTCELERVQKTCFRVTLGREHKGVWDWNVQAWYRQRKTVSILWKKCLLNTNHRSLFMRNILLHNHNLGE